MEYQDPAPGAPSSRDFFGRSVAGFGDDVLVGATGEDLGDQDAGAAYLFDGTTAQLTATLINPNRGVTDSFAHQVALIGDSLLISSPFA